jgi:2-C-methyl-D-erythritol 4-phosphate cytidylyltransferase
MLADTPKQYLSLGQTSLFLISLEFFFRLPEIDTVCMVFSHEGIDADPAYSAQDLADSMGATLVIAPGGARRQDSTLSGLRALPRDTEIVLVHDSARPFPPLEETRASIREARECGGAILAAPATDTIKLASADGTTIQQTLDRSQLWLAQTPQTFRYPELLEAMEAADREGADLTDEAMAFERLGYDVRIVPTTSENLKVTVPEDLRRAERILAERAGRSAL